MPLPTALQSQLDDLALFPDRTERVEALIAIAEEFVNPSATAVPRTAESRVPGCESEVYVHTEPAGAGLRYEFAVDNPQGISAMAFAQILSAGLDGVPPATVLQVPDEVVYDVFGQELSMGKSLGLMGMVRMAKAAAARFSVS